MVYESQSFTVTNRGLEFQTPLREDSDKGDYVMSLFCRNNELELTGGRPGLVAIRLVRTVKGFVRYCADKVLVASDAQTTHIWPGKPRIVHVPVVVSPSESRRLESRLQNAFRLRLQGPGIINVNLYNSFRRPEFKDLHSWDRVSSTFLTEGYPLFTRLLWLKISDAENRWPGGYSVMFGFTQSLTKNSDTEMAVGLQPWLALIGAKDDLMDIGEESAEIYDNVFEYSVNNYELYGPAMLKLAHIMPQAAHRGVELPKSATVVPCTLGSSQSVSQSKRRLNISVSLKDVEESGVIIHEVIVRSEFVEPESVDAIWSWRRRLGSRKEDYTKLTHINNYAIFD